jgi:hypothetical protein
MIEIGSDSKISIQDVLKVYNDDTVERGRALFQSSQRAATIRQQKLTISRGGAQASTK